MSSTVDRNSPSRFHANSAMMPIASKLPNGFDVTMLPHTELIVHEIWNEHCYDSDYAIKPGSVVVDIGANQGIFSLYAASKGAIVYAVEPDPENFRLLTKNIDDNRLADQITAFHCAIGTKTGPIVLFVPRSDRLCWSGLVTTSREQLEQIERVPGVEIGTTAGESITLATLLDTKIRSERIGLLKIDCEGAELDILNSASYREYERISNLVLETHGAYKESDLYHAILGLGFSITRYDKLTTKRMPHGSLFATKNREVAPARAHPVAILQAPSTVQIGQKALLDASPSFSAKTKAGELSFRWRVDGLKLEGIDEASSALHYSAETPGAHTITVSVRDRDLVDTAARCVWFLPAMPPATEHVQYLGEIGEAHEETVTEPGPHHYAINKESLRKIWDYERIVVGVTIHGSPPTKDEFSSIGRVVTIRDRYRLILFEQYPSDVDIHFTLRALQRGSRVQINWWFMREEDRVMARSR